MFCLFPLLRVLWFLPLNELVHQHGKSFVTSQKEKEEKEGRKEGGNVAGRKEGKKGGKEGERNVEKVRVREIEINCN